MKPALLKAERKSREWSQAEVAAAVGVSIKTVSRWEQGLTIPHPYYRSKLLILFGKTAEELGLLPDIDGDEEEIDQLPDSDEADEVQQVIPLVVYQSSSAHIGNISISLPFNRFPLRRVSTLSKIILIFAVIIAISLSFILEPLINSIHVEYPSPTGAPQQESYGPPSYTLTISNTNPSLQETAQHLQDVFNAVYPQLVNRFSLDPTTAEKSLILTLSSGLSSGDLKDDLTYTINASGTFISINSDWMQQHPNDIGVLTYGLTLLVEKYPSGAPSWFGDGVADYARTIYGPADDDDWSLPNGIGPQDSYTEGGKVAARFLLWLEQHTTVDIIDQLNHALQRGNSFSVVFRRLTHHTVDDFWRQYQAHPDVSLTPEQLYKAFTLVKPVYYQSSLDSQSLISDTFTMAWTPGLFMSNFAMQANMTIVRGDGGGFIFRSDGNQQYRLYVGSSGIYNLVKSSGSALTSGFSQAIRQGPNQTNQLIVIAYKHTIYVYINYQLIIQLNDSASSYGMVGEMAVNFGNLTDVRFSKILVF